MGFRGTLVSISVAFTYFSLLGTFFWPAAVAQAQGPVVDLGYSSYEGTTLSNGQNQFLGIRFAAPPLGDLRFRRPQPPSKTTGIQPAQEFGPVCFGLGQGLAEGTGEDCLFLNIWAPSDATPKSKHPVFFFIQGGGYLANINANFNGSDLVKFTGNNMIFLNFNYRAGPFGFLASEKIRANGDLNVALLDQRFAMEWAQQHITKFGGDPDRVVLIGDSSGAGSIALHLTAFGGVPTNLFAGVVGISPALSTQPRVSQLEFQFDLFAARAGCNGTRDPLACLRQQNSTVLQTANQAMAYPGRTTDAEAPYSPTVDGDLIPDFSILLFEEGKFVKVPSIFGDDTNEGTIFAPNASSPEEIGPFFQDNYPQLSDKDTAAIIAQYPKLPPITGHAAFFPSAAAAYGEATFICPGIDISTAIAQHTHSWNYRYNLLTPFGIEQGFGAYHTSELPLLFGPGNIPPGPGSPDLSVRDPALTAILQTYYTNFVRFLNPNGHNVTGGVFWPEFNAETRQRIILQDNVAVEAVPNDQLARCQFWKGLAVKTEQ